MDVGELIPGQSGPENEVQASVRVTGDEFDSPQEKEMLALSQKVRESIKELPPNIPEYRESNEFWDTVSILKQPNVTYGDITILNAQADKWGSRIHFKRAIIDPSGKEIGKWGKHGFITPDDRLTNFFETIVSPDFQTEQEVGVNLDDEGKISKIYKITFNDGKRTGITEMNYTYDDRDGSLCHIRYAEIGSDGRQIGTGKNQWFSPNTPIQAIQAPPAAPAEVPAPTENRGRLSRIFRRK